MIELGNITRSIDGQFYNEAGGIIELERLISNFNRPLIITGHKSFEAFKKSYKSHNKKLLEYPLLKYDHSSSEENILELVEKAKKYNSDIIVAIGGGKLIDTAKGVADRLNIDIATIPTVISNCAAVTPLGVVYDKNNCFLRFDYFKRSGFLCIVDYELLLDSPIEYFIGGICDTIAKWYEAEAITRQYDITTLPALVQVGLAIAKVSKEILLKDAQKAVNALKNKEINEEFKRVVDTVFAVAGYVGSQAGQYGRISGAHAIHNGLTQFSETNSIQHGVKVSYGVLVQLVYTKDYDEVKKLIKFYKENGYIYSWNQLGIKTDFEVAAKKVAEYSSSDKESFKLIDSNINSEKVYQAIVKLEGIVGNLEL